MSRNSLLPAGQPGRATGLRARLLILAATGALVAAPLAVAGPASAAAPTVVGSAAGGYVPVVSHRIVDTATGVGISKGTLKAGSWHVVSVAGKARVPRGVTSALLAFTVTSAKSTGFVSVGPSKGGVSSAVTFLKGGVTSELMPVSLSASGTFYLRASAAVGLRVAVEGYTTSDATGSSWHSATGGLTTAAAAAAASPSTRFTLAGGHSATLQVPMAKAIPTSATSAFLTVRALTPRATGTLLVGATRGDAAPAVAFSAGHPAAGSVISRLASGNRVMVVNTSGRPISFQLILDGYFSPVGGVLYHAVPPTQVGKVQVKAHKSAAVSLAAAVPAASSGAVLSMVVRNPAVNGTVKVGSAPSSSLSSVVFSRHVTSLVTVVSDVTASSTVNVTNTTSKTLVVQVTVLGYLRPVGAASGAPGPGPGGGAPPVPPLPGPPPSQTTAGALTLQNLDAYPANDRMVFNRIENPDTTHPPTVEMFHDTGVLRLSNTGTAALAVSAVQVTGPFQLASPAALPLTLPVNGHVDLTVRFVATSGRVSFGALAIGSNAGTNPSPVVTLAGFFQSYSEHTPAPTASTDPKSVSTEPTPQELGQMMGWSTNIPASLNTHGSATKLGDEIISPYWKIADPAHLVHVRQIDEWHSFPQSAVSFNWNDATPAHEIYGVMSAASEYSQSVLPLRPDLQTPAGAYFLPTATVFGFNVDGTSGEYSDDSLNLMTVDQSNGCSGACGHHMRFFPVKDASGADVANTYYMTMDYSGSAANYDFQDNGYVISNITPNS